jgi:hypothetical protein
MTDDQLRETFTRVEVRLERLDTHVDQLDKRLSDGFAVVHARLEGIENRLARKADTWVMTTGLGGLGLLLTIYKFFI